MNTFKKLKNPILWVDLEMTGLNVLKDSILEFACILTDGEIETQIDGPEMVIHADQEVLDHMDEWCINQFKKSGLDKSALASEVSIQDCEKQILQFLKDNKVAPKEALIGGNSVGVDRSFIAVHMPLLTEYLHYRVVDVTTIKELARRWNPEVSKQVPNKAGSHRAKDDIIESIEELKYYKRTFFKL